MGGLNLNYLTLITAVLNASLGIIVVRSKGNTSLRWWFLLFTSFLFLWCLTNFLFESYSISLFLLKSQYSTGGLVLVSALPWVILMASNVLKKRTVILICLLALIIFLLPYGDGLLIAGISRSASGGFVFQQGPIFNVYGLILFLLMAGIISILVVGLKKSTGEKKDQLRFVLIGITLFAATSLVVNVLLPALGITPVVAFDAQSSLFWVVLTTFAITRYKLFNIKVIATQIFVGLLLFLIMARILSANTRSDIIFESVVLIFTAVVAYFLIQSVKGEVSRREEVERLAKERIETLKQLEQRNKNLATLQRISQVVLNENEMKPMAQKILNEIPKEMDSCIGALLNLTRNSHLVSYAITTTDFSEKIFSLVGNDLEKYSEPIEKGFNLIHTCLTINQAQESEQLSDFISPPIPKTVALTIQKIMGIRFILAVPLYSGTEPLGVMMFAFRLRKNDLNEKDIEIAKAIADDMSLAIQRANAFQKLKDANDYLSELDKMKDEFISMASHELNTPLAAIEGYLSMILDEHMGKIDKKSQLFLGRAYESSKRLAELILDLLNVPRIEQGRLKMKFAQANLADLAESVIHELQIKTDAKHLYLKLEADRAKLPLLWCDPDRIREVFVNLIGNAIKFTEKGGITVKISASNTVVHTEIVDTGRGIAEADKKKLFQKFSQIHREIDEQKGTGLGLYISKNFVDLHRGTIWVESQPGKGSRFIFELPVTKAPPTEVTGAILDNPNLGSPKIEVDKQTQPVLPAKWSH